MLLGYSVLYKRVGERNWKCRAKAQNIILDAEVSAENLKKKRFLKPRKKYQIKRKISRTKFATDVMKVTRLKTYSSEERKH